MATAGIYSNTKMVFRGEFEISKGSRQLDGYILTPTPHESFIVSLFNPSNHICVLAHLDCTTSSLDFINQIKIALKNEYNLNTLRIFKGIIHCNQESTSDMNSNLMLRLMKENEIDFEDKSAEVINDACVLGMDTRNGSIGPMPNNVQNHRIRHLQSREIEAWHFYVAFRLGLSEYPPQFALNRATRIISDIPPFDPSLPYSTLVNLELHTEWWKFKYVRVFPKQTAALGALKDIDVDKDYSPPKIQQPH